jgi:hypothetical protein
VLGVLGAIIVASVAVMIGFRRGGVASPQRGVSFASLKEGYRTILHNPNARVCFTAVLSRGFAFSASFRSSPRFCSSLAKPARRSPAWSSRRLQSAGCFIP